MYAVKHVLKYRKTYFRILSFLRSGGVAFKMGKTLAYKILENHLIEGTLKPGEEIKI